MQFVRPVAASITAAILTLSFTSPVLATPERSLEKCARSAQREASRYIKRRVGAVGKCIDKVANRLIVKGDADVSGAAKSCVNAFGKISGDDPSRDLEQRLRGALAKACDPAANDRLEHTENDILGPGATVAVPLNAGDLGDWCAWFGGDGKIESIDDWVDCIAANASCSADAALSAQYPRLLEWLDLVRIEMNLLSPVPTEQVAGLDEVNDGIDGSVDDARPEIRCGASLFPSTGQQTAYTAETGDGPGSAVADDGTLRAGSGLRYVDNGDGTITDLNTNLMWEKKSAGDGLEDLGNLHDADNGYAWSDDFSSGDDTIWDWLEAVNAEGGTGFAGHDDWRIPNAKEALSLIDYETNSPAVAPAFHDAVNCAACSDVTLLVCTCTDADQQWTSTTRNFNTAQAWAVDFSDGAITQRGKTSGLPVRAVRSGL